MSRHEVDELASDRSCTTFIRMKMILQLLRRRCKFKISCKNETIIGKAAVDAYKDKAHSLSIFATLILTVVLCISYVLQGELQTSFCTDTLRPLSAREGYSRLANCFSNALMNEWMLKA
ncbi:hypothetical protein ACSBR1_009964 [Camellia fascicularis]